MLGCSIRAIWILNNHSQVLFSRKFPTVERQWQTACKKQDITTCPLPTDLQLAEAFVNRKHREGSDHGSSIRDALTKEGSDSWIDDPVTRYVISLQLPRLEDGSAPVLLWPIVIHSRNLFQILVLPLVDPQQLVAYEDLCWRMDCGGGTDIEGSNWSKSSLSTIILESPGITGAFAVAQVLGDVVAGEVIEPDIFTNSASTMSGLLDSITGGIGISNIAARAKPVAVPVAAAAAAAVSTVAGTVNATLSGLANKSTLKSNDREALRSFISSAMPFGTPLDINPVNIAAIRLNGFTIQDIPPTDQRQPAWKPYLFRGKQRIVFGLHEVITAALYDRDDVADVISLAGQIMCRADLEGLPDITLPLSFPASTQIDSLAFHPCAQVFEQSLEKQTITFSPPLGSFPLAKYVASSCAMRPPLQGFYQLSMVSEDEGAFLFRLKLMEGHKAPMTMEHCSLLIPFPRRKIVAIDGVPSVGTVTTSEHAIEWKIVVGNRSLTSKSIETTFSGTIKFAPRIDSAARNGPKSMNFSSEEESEDDLENDSDSDHRDASEPRTDKAEVNLAAADWEEPFCWEAYNYAKASFKLVGATLSGLSVDPKLAAIYPTTKAASESSAQVVSGEYILWNSLGRYPSAVSPSV